MKKSNDEEFIILRSGNQSIFASVKKGETILLGDPSTFVDPFVTMEKQKRQIEDDLDDILYSKPIALVKKLNRRIKKK